MSTAPVPVFSLTLTPRLLAPPLAPLPSLVQGSLRFPETRLSSPDTLSQQSALCVTRQLWHHSRPVVRSLSSPPLSWQRGSCLLQSTLEGDCPCAWREDRQKRRHGNACSGPEDMENSIGCSAGWRGRETPGGERGREAVLHTQPGCLRATGSACLGIWHLRWSEDLAPKELGAGGEAPQEASLGGASLSGTLSVPGAAAASTFMPCEEESKAQGLAPGLR